ncbi:MAG: flagellar FliJ family protein [Synergistaceae bacterium]|jgi:flagellar export protein FliJ|nr:flagellar FliJ family protein [Synergistaceae bacterium]
MRQRIQRFDRILKLRENDRRTEQITLAEERREEETVLRRIDSLGVEKKRAIEDFFGGAEKIVSPQVLWFQRQSIDVIEKRLGETRENLSDVRRRITGTEERLLERHRDARMMESYLDRLKTDARKELMDIEQSELDDIAVTRFNHGLARSSRRGVRVQKEASR